MKANQRAILPNTLTFANLCLGFFAILLFSQGRYITGAWLMAVAGIFDGLDGAAARLVKSSSKFGGQVDSLADLVSFGVAPATLVFHMLFDHMGFWPAAMLASLPLLTAATRLARFNVLSEAHGHGNGFSGMPSPAAASMFASFFIYAHYDADGFNTLPIWLSLVFLVSLLMITPIPYRRMPVVPLHGAKHPSIAIAVIVLTTALLLINIRFFFFPLMVMYLLTGPIEWMIHQITQVRDRIKIVEVDDERRPRRRRNSR